MKKGYGVQGEGGNEAHGKLLLRGMRAGKKKKNGWLQEKVSGGGGTEKSRIQIPRKGLGRGGGISTEQIRG